MPARVISKEAACTEKEVLLDYSTYEVVLEKPEIGSSEPNIVVDNN